MPIYDYECPNCSAMLEHYPVQNRKEEVFCEKCSCLMRRLFPCHARILAFPDQGITLENVGPNPITFTSRGKMKQYAKDHDLELGALL